jgi:pyridoxamine 5'-phosphate oxidase-like protein
MPANITTEQVWREVEKRSFAVLGYTTPRGEARTVGIVYAVRDREIYLVTGKDSWKARHIASNPHVSLTITISKRIPFVPWLQIPAATISLQGTASVHTVADVPPEIPRRLLRDLELNPGQSLEICVIRVHPAGEFLTYGVGVPLLTMRKPEASRGRAPV